MGLCNSKENYQKDQFITYIDLNNDDSGTNLGNEDYDDSISSNILAHMSPKEDKNSQSDFESCSNDNKYAFIDIIINDQERLNIKQKQDTMHKYYFDLSTFSYNYFNYYKQRKELNEKNSQKFLQNPDKQTLLSKIRVLIVIESIVDLRYLENDSNYFENSEDLTTAFLICHLFHYAFLIPYSQILITLTNENGFIDEKTKIRFQDMDNETKMSKISDLSFYFWQNEFGFHQNVNYAQVGRKQYKFYLENELLERIKPFNHKIITDEIKPDCESDLFIFILDHCTSSFYNKCNCTYVIDELVKIPCSHYYVMNDSTQSSSLIEIIKASYDFESIIKTTLDTETEGSLIKLLFTYGNFDSEIKLAQSIRSLIKMIDQKEEHNKEFIKIFEIIIMNEIPNLLKFGNKIKELFPSGVLDFVPQNFTRFGDKSTIFSSSDNNNISLTLPVRRISASLQDNFRICGSIFSSIFIESLLTHNSSLNSFCSSIKKLFFKYKNDFESIIITQNQHNNKTETNSNNKNKISKKAILSFFDMDLFENKHFFIHSDRWPDLHSIFISNEQFWNVDCSDVNSDEYKDVFFFDLVKETTINLNNYGPKRGMSSIEKFSIDYEDAVKEILEKNGFTDVQFSTCQPSKDDLENKYKDLKFANWSKFFVSIRPYYSSKIGMGIMALRYPISLFFYNNHDFNVEIGLKIFLEAFLKIYPFWKDHSLYF